MQVYPLVSEFAYIDPEWIIRECPREGMIFLDSRRSESELGRYSFLGVSPFQIITCQHHVVSINDQRVNDDPFAVLEAELMRFSLSTREGLPPFQGGAAGMLGYEMAWYLETLPSPKVDDLQCPEMVMGFYDLVIAWDHREERAWIFSSGYPCQDALARAVRANTRLAWAGVLIAKAKPRVITAKEKKLESVSVTFGRDEYMQAVERVKEYICAGDIFEVNISQRFSIQCSEEYDIFDLYCELYQINPAPFSAFLQYKTWRIASASPERFLKMVQGQVETRPIKGTRARHADKVEDEALARALLASEKDRAENIMIVDLMRNDLSRVCLPHSVKVPQLCGVESYRTVHHLVSVVQGTMMPDKTAIDLLRATFPGGSITGAPKIRAMEIITEIEPMVRGPYCGSIGYIGFDHTMDLSITIRTFVVANNQITFQVGGAVTVDSDPLEEYEETLVKARALQRALGLRTETITA